jgi:cytochrome c
MPSVGVVRCLAAAGLAAVLFACGAASPDLEPSVDATAAAGAPRPVPFDSGPVRPAREYLAEPRFAGADLARGELLGLACLACHKVVEGEGTLVGPNLHGVFGRPAASVPGFAYSPALGASGLVWTPVSIEAWLADPAGFVAGTTMAFTGYRSPEDRRDLIAYLLVVTE